MDKNESRMEEVIRTIKTQTEITKVVIAYTEGACTAQVAMEQIRYLCVGNVPEGDK